MSSSTFSEPHSRKNAKRPGHVLKLPLPLLIGVLDLWEARIRDPARGDSGKVLVHGSLGAGGEGSRWLGAGCSGL